MGPLEIIALIVMLAGTTISITESRKASKYSADVYEAESRAAKKKAAYEADQQRDRTKRLLSKQRALYGKAGVDMTGTPLLALEESAEIGELDALAIQYGGDIAAARARSEATLIRMEGRRKATATAISTGGSLLTTAAKRT